MNWPPMPKDTSVEIRQYGEKQVFVFNDHATALEVDPVGWTGGTGD